MSVYTPIRDLPDQQDREVAHRDHPGIEIDGELIVLHHPRRQVIQAHDPARLLL